jgi:hypothetical protein
MIKTNIKLQTKLNEPSQAAKELPFFPMLPASKIGLLVWRVYVVERCIHDKEFRDEIWYMCSLDVAFFAATFCWGHETRDDAFTDEAGAFPFKPWTDQVDLLAWLQLYGGRNDMTIEKTRGIGLSWVAMIFLFWKWLFSKGGTLDFGVLSKDDTSLDMVGRPSTLMGKLDVLFDHLPYWAKTGPDGKSILHRTHQNHKFRNRLNDNAIVGFTSTDDKLRSARLNLLIVDEAAFLPVDVQRWLASSQFVSSSRIFISTHDGTATMFYRLTIDDKSTLVRISTWWQDNPERWKGAYIVEQGRVRIIDTNYKYPPDYEFMFENPGLIRSPWVDSEFRKPGIDEIRLKQEIYGVAALDTKRMIQKEVTDMAKSECTPPVIRANLVDGEFVEALEGDFYLWQEMLFDSVYYVGVDPALGVVDKSLAALVVMDAKSGKVVISAAFKEMSTIDLAKTVKAVCEALVGTRGPAFAQIVPEVTGIGVTFMTELNRLRWGNIYTDGTKVGIHNSDRGEKLLVELGRAIRDRDVSLSDERIVDDLEHFEYNSALDLVFTGMVGHGDLGQAAALAWWGARLRRRAVLEAERKPWDDNKQPIEREPGYRKPNRKRGWSQRFSRI